MTVCKLGLAVFRLFVTSRKISHRKEQGPGLRLNFLQQDKSNFKKWKRGREKKKKKMSGCKS